MEKYHHALFFQTEEEAHAIELWVKRNLIQSDKAYGPAYDADGKIWEFRFYTNKKMNERTVKFLLASREMQTHSSYALNVEDYS